MISSLRSLSSALKHVYILRESHLYLEAIFVDLEESVSQKLNILFKKTQVFRVYKRCLIFKDFF